MLITTLSFRSWFAVCWRLGAGRLEQCPGCRLKHNSCFSLQPGQYSSLTAPNLQHTSNQEQNDQCGNQQYSRELLMMGVVVPEIYRAYKKYNKIICGIQLVFYSSVIPKNSFSALYLRHDFCSLHAPGTCSMQVIDSLHVCDFLSSPFT